ncbi:hypothetical protein ACR6HW_00300 [Fusibacter sp. JL298sf-3]
MIIKHPKGKYELKVDQKRRIVYESFDGLLKPEDINQMHDDYLKKIYPMFRGKQWTKCSDLRNYQTSQIVDESDKHLHWCHDNGMVPGAILVDSTIVKFQMKRVSKDNDLMPTPFSSMEEAENWLKGQGF